jgi:hypothetical protein
MALCFSFELEILISSLVSVLLISLLHTKTIEKKYLFYCKTLFRHHFICHLTICPNKSRASPIDFATIRKLKCVEREPIRRAPKLRDCNSGKFLTAFAKLQKATVSFVMSVRLSVRMEQLVSH